MNKKWCFDKMFLKEKIEEGKMLLETMDEDSEEMENVLNMIAVLEELLGIQNNENNENNISTNRIIKNLNDNINEDLKLVTIDEWRELRDFCKNIPKVHFKDINSSKLPKKNNCVIDTALDFYKGIDLEVYKSCKEILRSNYELLNFSSTGLFRKGNISSNYSISCDHLNLPFINISCDKDLKYPVTVHELRHAANYLLYGDKRKTLLQELPSIYSELLFTDKINELYKCNNLYNFRINDVGISMRRVVKYINILERFDECGRQLTDENIVDVLGISSNIQTLQMYKQLIKSPYLKSYNYIISTLIALAFRENYYNGYGDRVNKDLEKIMLGSKVKLNYDKLAEKYVDHVNYVHSLSKK